MWGNGIHATAGTYATQNEHSRSPDICTNKEVTIDSRDNRPLKRASMSSSRRAT